MSKIEKCLSWSPFSTSTAVPTRIVWYCKAECQRLDWAYHKAKCKTKEKRAEEKAAGMALVTGSFQGRLALVRTMLERGADVNFVTVDDFTAFVCGEL